MSPRLTFAELDWLCGPPPYPRQTPCPICSPKRKLHHQCKPVLALWRLDADFISFACAHCELKGFARRDGAARLSAADRTAIERKAAQLRADDVKQRQLRARKLWRQSRPIEGTPAHVYLREARVIALDQWPATLGFLPRHGDIPPRLIAAFGVPEIGGEAIGAEDDLLLADHLVSAVQVICLRDDGSGKAYAADDPDPRHENKRSYGTASGQPIVLAPFADSNNGLLICEGIENGLSLVTATGLAMWATGGAKFMPKLAPTVPDYVDHVTVVADDDPDGRKYAGRLIDALRARRIPAELKIWGRR